MHPTIRLECHDVCGNFIRAPISIVAIDCANKNRPVSIARDRTVRVWKVEEDSHLVYRGGGHVGSAECITAIQDGWFVTGHDDGRLLLWKEEKKRPVGDVITAAHGHENGVARGVISCGALGLSDVLATGSNDGYLRLWKVSFVVWSVDAINLFL